MYIGYRYLWPFLSLAIVGAQTTKQVEVPNGQNTAISVTGAFRPVPRNVIKMVDRLPNGAMISFSTSGHMPSPLFRTGYFAMPIVNAPYEAGKKDHFLIFNNEVYYFLKNENGFSLISKEPLPKPPPEPLLDNVNELPFRDEVQKIGFLQAQLSMNGNVGFQIDEDGAVYWVSPTSVRKHTGSTWKTVYAYRREFVDRNKLNYVKTGTVVLPKGRVALIGGENEFIEIIDLGASPEEAKSIKTVGYEAIESDSIGYPPRATPEFCISGEKLFFYLRCTGRIYRLDLNTYNLKEYSVPWMKIQYAKAGGSPTWSTGNATVNTEEPVVPDSISFALSPDGNIRSTALMFNMPTPGMHVFNLDGESLTVVSEFKLSEDLLEPNVYCDHGGEFKPMSSAREMPKKLIAGEAESQQRLPESQRGSSKNEPQ